MYPTNPANEGQILRHYVPRPMECKLQAGPDCCSFRRVAAAHCVSRCCNWPTARGRAVAGIYCGSGGQRPPYGSLNLSA